MLFYYLLFSPQNAKEDKDTSVIYIESSALYLDAFYRKDAMFVSSLSSFLLVLFFLFMALL